MHIHHPLQQDPILYSDTTQGTVVKELSNNILNAALYFAGLHIAPSNYNNVQNLFRINQDLLLHLRHPPVIITFTSPSSRGKFTV